APLVFEHGNLSRASLWVSGCASTDQSFLLFCRSIYRNPGGRSSRLGPCGCHRAPSPLDLCGSPVSAIIMLDGIYFGAMYGGSTPSILVNIPGEAASVVTCLDGHAMARQGRAGPALGISAFGSFIAGTLSVVVLTFLAPSLAKVALSFGPPEY